MEKENFESIKKFFDKRELDVFGIADMTEYEKTLIKSDIHPSILDLVRKLNYGISFACKLSDQVLETIEGEPNSLYAFHYRRVNQILDSLQVELCFYIEKQGYQALPIPASQVVDFKQMTAHLSHRHIAYLAGLGWYGRNNLLVHHLYGSSLRFATVLTDMPLTLGKITSNDCGPCRKCATLCPANAINESFRDFSKDKCQEKLREFQRKPGVNHMICGVCVKACRGKKTWVK